jgi:hypothetical protein
VWAGEDTTPNENARACAYARAVGGCRGVRMSHLILLQLFKALGNHCILIRLELLRVGHVLGPHLLAFAPARRQAQNATYQDTPLTINSKSTPSTLPTREYQAAASSKADDALSSSSSAHGLRVKSFDSLAFLTRERSPHRNIHCLYRLRCRCGQRPRPRPSPRHRSKWPRKQTCQSVATTHNHQTQ